MKLSNIKDSTVEDHHDAKARRKMLDRAQNGAILDHPRKTNMVKFQKLNIDGQSPSRANENDAGWDLYSSEKKWIPRGGRSCIKTSISLEMPDNMVGLIWPRSGLAVKKGLDLFAGVIDSGYRGEIIVCLFNSTEIDVEIEKGDRVAQIIFHELPKISMVESSLLTNSERGEGGFGSSGK